MKYSTKLKNVKNKKNMSVFYHNDDPLLHQTMFQSSIMNQQNASNNLSDAYAQMYKQQLMMEMQQQQQQPLVRDWVGDLDKAMKELDSTTIEMLNNNVEFSNLNIQLQALVQKELMALVKIKINSNDGAVDNIKKQMDIMKNTTQKVKDEEKQNFNDLNDYMKNYSHLTFNEYRKLKNGYVNEERTETVRTNEEPQIVTTNINKNKKPKKRDISYENENR